MFKVLFTDFIGVVKSTAPLVLALVALKLLLRSQFASVKQFSLGLVFVLIGLFALQLGISMCLVPLGRDVGESLPRLNNGLLILLACFAIGFTSTLVEPALREVVRQASDVSIGAISGTVLTYATAIGTATGMALGVAKVLYNLKSAYLFAPLLVLLFILCLTSKEPFVSLSFDCAAATTGPVNIPIIAAISGGLALALGIDPLRVGFGLVGLSCFCSAASVMLASVIRL